MWYKVEINHGPGHQSRCTDYIWQDHELTYNEKRDIFDDYACYYDAATGNVELVDSLPEQVRQEKLKMYKQRLKTCQEMIAILEAK